MTFTRKKKESEVAEFHNFSLNMTLVDNHENKPIWIGGNRENGSDNRIFIEVKSPHYNNASKFILSIAEPMNRPDYIHEYHMTKHSLYAAASVHFDSDAIEKTLLLYSKNTALPPAVKNFIKKHCTSYGKAKLVLRNQQYFIEAVDHATINTIKRIPEVARSVRTLEEEKKASAGKRGKGLKLTDAQIAVIIEN
jgi:DNA excision repair protein ERCC-3